MGSYLHSSFFRQTIDKSKNEDTAPTGGRYLTGDPPALADAASRIIDGEQELTLTDMAVVETAYVLSTVYKVPRVAVVDSLLALIQKRNIILFALEKQVAMEAFRSTR